MSANEDKYMTEQSSKHVRTQVWLRYRNQMLLIKTNTNSKHTVKHNATSTLITVHRVHDKTTHQYARIFHQQKTSTHIFDYTLLGMY